MTSEYGPGWYDNPDGETQWWDGGAWQQKAPSAPPTSQPATSPGGQRTLLWAVLASGATLLVVLLCCCGGYLLLGGESEPDDTVEEPTTSVYYDEGYEEGLSLGDDVTSDQGLAQMNCSLRATLYAGYEEGSYEFEEFMDGCVEATGW